jgi:hypothetical protein
VAIRDCQVSFEDLRGVRHSVTVQASSVLEAAGLGLKRVREQEMLDDDAGFSDVTVEVGWPYFSTSNPISRSVFNDPRCVMFNS